VRENSIKRMLAYSTITNLAYIILAFAILNQGGVYAAGAHIVTHAIAKITLFFVAGAILLLANANYLQDINGLGKSQKLLFACFFLCSLSLIGVPFSAGGHSKELILLAAKDAEISWVFYIAYAAMALTAFYLLRVSYYAFFKPAKNIVSSKDNLTSHLMKVVIVITTALGLAYPLYSGYITKLLEKVII
jgi:multicomponent Na+:H+ antiporter subunit D